MAQPTLVLHGNFRRANGFTLINRRLRDGLRARGFDVFPAALDDAPDVPVRTAPSDIYFFHGDPYAFVPAPARLRVCFAHWEYRRLPRAWVDALNQHFDLVIAPSHASRDVYRASGLTRPMVVFPAAVDPREFHPRVPAWNAPTPKNFRFAHLGGAHERRGTDLVLAAYAAEFSAADDVALILKAFHYEHHRAWLETRLRAFDAPNAPPVIYLRETFDSVAPVFTAADVGVYPLRAECFGLPVLECLASGRRVIVTENTALDEFCTPENADFVSARLVENGDHTFVEPDVTQLRALMRRAYARGKADAAEHARIAATVASYTWSRSLDILADALATHWQQSTRALFANPLPPRAQKNFPAAFRFLVVAPSFREWDLGTYVANLLRARQLQTDTFAYRGIGDRFSANAKLLDHAAATRPDVILGLKMDLVEPETLCALRALGIRVALWHVDCFDENIPAHTARLVQNVDVAFVTAQGMVPKYAALGTTPVHWLYEGAYLPAFPDVEIPPAQMPLYQTQVAFVGNILHPPVQDQALALQRFHLLARVSERFQLKIWGVQGNATTRARWGQRAPLIEWHTHHAELVKVCRASDIVLGLNTINTIQLYFSNRVFLTLACGGFHLTHYVPGLETMFTNHQHLVWFHSDDECLEWIAHYLARPEERRRIAAAGKAWVRERYSMDVQIEKLVRALQEHCE
jgi:glycosyltransferase involved in cell wall biosynthesis